MEDKITTLGYHKHLNLVGASSMDVIRNPKTLVGGGKK